jgi:putative FmdB family regulatory protein
LPTYEYRCVSCEHQFERFQRMSDDPVKECEVCGEPVKRILFPVAIQFKGNGFYTTDYARKSTLGAGGGHGSGGSEVSSSDSSAASETSNSSDSSAKPAASEPSKPVPSAAGAKSD